MTREEFYEYINLHRWPKYFLSQIKEGKPSENCAAIICTVSGKMGYANYENGRWYQAHFYGCGYEYGYEYGYSPQQMYYTPVEEEVLYWTDGVEMDKSRPQ